jgi:8-oxo-dGTP pyrophosphatase MutT (NUDIX family)
MLPSASYVQSSGQHKPTTYHPPSISAPTTANYPSTHLTLGAGVAIFHLRTARVVLCYHSRDHYYFLPKGRKDAGETLEHAACREGFEESGYRCRLIGIVARHRQPMGAEVEAQMREAGAKGSWGSVRVWSTEALWCQMVPVGRGSQYVLFWYVAETVDAEEEGRISALEGRSGSTGDGAGETNGKAKAEEDGGATTAVDADGVVITRPSYVAPRPLPTEMTITERIALEPEDYVPPRHLNTGVDEEEAMYESYLIPVEEAIRKLRGTVMADVIRRGWDGICKRREIEDGM